MAIAVLVLLALLRAPQQEIRRHVFNYFVHEPPSIAQDELVINSYLLFHQVSDNSRSNGLRLNLWTKSAVG
jgi:hypothetical protein